jgi:sec-independent protein translocase protein TatA
MGSDGLIVIVVVAIVLLFGGSQLPKLARGLGSASHEFKKGVEEGDNAAGSVPQESTAAPTPSLNAETPKETPSGQSS